MAEPIENVDARASDGASALKEYELTFLLRAEDKAEEVLVALKKHGAEVTSQGTLVRQRLAYPIKKETQAVMGSLTFRLDPEAMAGLDHDLRFNAHVIRFLAVTPPIKKPQGLMYERRAPQAAVPSPEGPAVGRPSVPRKPRAVAPKKPEPAQSLSNEALEKRLEEILQ